jgi:hypothetical protein
LRKVTKSACGDAGEKAASKQTVSASKKKGGIIKDYIDNWKRIQQITSCNIIPNSEATALLHGLQELDSERDTKFFQEWGEQSTSYMGHRGLNVTWIWKVAMAGNALPGDRNDKQTIRDLTAEWESEGKWIQSHLQRSILNISSSKARVASHFLKK